MHISHKLGLRTVGIRFFQEEVFRNLILYTHKEMLYLKGTPIQSFFPYWETKFLIADCSGKEDGVIFSFQFL